MKESDITTEEKLLILKEAAYTLKIHKFMCVAIGKAAKDLGILAKYPFYEGREDKFITNAELLIPELKDHESKRDIMPDSLFNTESVAWFPNSRSGRSKRLIILSCIHNKLTGSISLK